MAGVNRIDKKLINPGIFKAYDIRGKYPTDINEGVVFEIARVLGNFFGKGKIVVAHDTRIGSSSLYKAAIKGLKTYNLKLITIGMATTPMLYFLVGKLKAQGGIMVTASHNPKEYNGLKVVRKNVEMISGFEVKRRVLRI